MQLLLLILLLLLLSSSEGFTCNRIINDRRLLSLSFKSKANLDEKTININDKIDSNNENNNTNSNQDNDVTLPKTSLSLSLSQIKPFLDIATPFFQNDKVARNSLAGVVALTLVNSGISVGFSYVSRDFYNALNERNEALFYEKIGLFFGFLVIAVPCTVAYRFYREKLSLYWREALTSNVLDKYYNNRTFYVFETLKNVDNPDQRIAEDIKSFTKTSLDFFITLFTAVIDLISFSAILYSIYPLLFVAIIVYAGIGSIITTKLGQSLVGLNYDRLNKEANFRFSLIRTRENAESIALYDSSAGMEKDGLWGTFTEILKTQLGIITTQRNLEYFTTSYRYLVQILPSLIVAPLYFAHKVELGTINQSYSAFNHILGDFSIIINQFEALSAFSASVYRLTDFFDSLGNKDKSANSVWDVSNSISNSNSNSIVKPVTELAINTGSNEEPLLSIKNLCVLTPDAHRILIGGIGTNNLIFNPTSDNDNDSNDNLEKFWNDIRNGINVNIEYNDKILIVGPSGSGKSSFVRAICGLWRVGKGNINWNFRRPSNSYTNSAELPREIFVLPQKPYMTLGSLKEQIMYPLHDSNENVNNAELDVQLLSILDQVKLDKLALRVGEGDAIRGLHVSQDWSKILSLGEQQRLSFARILYNKPDVIVLDESTSALDLATEEAMYQLLSSTVSTYISVGHRPSLIKYHNKKLILRGPGLESVLKLIAGDQTLTE